MIDRTLIKWLLDSDVSIQFQVYRDLLKTNKPELQKRIANEGWGKLLLSLRQNNGHWGLGYYQPKWTSSHYTLLELKNLNISNSNYLIKETIQKILTQRKGPDGGINAAKSLVESDVCVNGMFLNYASYFESEESELRSIVDFIISQQLPDGGFNCRFNRSGAKHSSLHSTLSVIEGIFEYAKNGYSYKVEELKKAEKESREFILEHRLFKSDKTGNIIDKKMLTLSYPSRWRYDILRALDYFQMAEVEYDERMLDSIQVILKKRNKNYTWNLQANHKGKTHFDMEETRKPSRWNTLRAMRVLKYFKII